MATIGRTAALIGLLLAVASTFQACSNTSTLSASTAPSGLKPRPSVTLMADEPAVRKSDNFREVQSKIVYYLDRELFDDDEPYLRGEQLKIHFRVEQFDPGSKWLRVLLRPFGGDAGNAKVVTAFRLVDSSDHEVDAFKVTTVIRQTSMFTRTANQIGDEVGDALGKYMELHYR